MSKRVLYNVSSANLQATNISGGTISSNTISGTTFTGSNLSLSGNLNVAGTLTTVNITSTNLVNTNVSAGIVVASTSLSATGTSNTIGSIFTNSGNVGIGTTSPTGTLTVLGPGSGGTIRIYPTSYRGETNVMFYDGITGGSAGWFVGQGPFNGGTNFAIGHNGIGGPTMTIRTNGNVGIGTTAPTQRLEVNGKYSNYTNSTTGYIMLNEGFLEDSGYISFHEPNGTRKGYIGYGRTDTSFLIQGEGSRVIIIATNNVERMRIDQNGSVGIGTTAPLELLDVRGNLRVGGSSQANYILFNGTSGDQSGTVDGHTYIGERLYGGTESSELLLFKGNDISGGPGPDRIRHLAANHVFDTYTTPLSGTFEGVGTSGTTRMLIDQNGNVGIGTTAPQSKLHLASGNTYSNILFEPGYSSDGLNPGFSAINFNGYYNAGDQRINTGKSRWRVYTDQRTTSDQMNIDNYNGTTLTTLMSFTTAGNVGIGISSPSSKLHVVGSTSNSGGIIADFRNSGNAERLQIIDETLSSSLPGGILNAGSGFGIGIYARAGPIRFFTKAGNLERMTITDAGNIGIGTTSPTAPLHILESSANNTNPTGIFIDKNGERAALQVWNYNNNTTNLQLSSNMYWNSSGGSIVHNTSSGKAWNLSMGSNQDSLRVARFTAADTSSTLFTINSAGNVGIGTNDPGFKLEVNNVVQARGSGRPYFAVDNTTTAGWSLGMETDNTFRIKGGQGGGNLFTDEGNINRLTISTGGYVGIGTTSPRERLHVDGNIFLNTNGNIWITGNSDSDVNRFRLHNSDSGSYIDFNGGPLSFRSGIDGGNVARMSLTTSGNLSISGALSKGSGTFEIDHPILENKRLVHSFIEGPRCDLIYRGKVTLINGTATVNMDIDCVKEVNCAMTNGTFTSLCDNPQFFLQNPNSFNRLRGSISGNILTIICEDSISTDEVYWQVIAERKDTFIKQWDKTNVNGYLITEHNKE